MTAALVAPQLTIRFRGELGQLDAAERRALLSRQTSESRTDVSERTARIIQAVRTDGDAALRRFAEMFDGVTLAAIQVDMSACHAALAALEPELRAAMERSRNNIACAHRAFLPAAVEVETEPGVIIGRRPDAFATAGVYAPGGRAAYPSSLLMGAVAARVAGVARVIVCSPPGPDGLPAPSVLAAAALADVDAVFAIGGAGAIAAMAYGTDTVPRVDVIVGPGNAYVAEAKEQLARTVATDTPAGPSELLVIADATSDPAVVAMEMLAQAEHDPEAVVVTICVDGASTSAIERALETLVVEQTRADIMRSSLERGGAVLSAVTMDEAISFANEYAPEHLLLAIDERTRQAVLGRIRNAGTVFLGERSSVAFGDYMTGANHVLPTAGLARIRSGLSPLDFIRWTTWQRVTESAAASLAGDVALFAQSEGLDGHARAAQQWRHQ